MRRPSSTGGQSSHYRQSARTHYGVLFFSIFESSAQRTPTKSKTVQYLSRDTLLPVEQVRTVSRGKFNSCADVRAQNACAKASEVRRTCPLKGLSNRVCSICCPIISSPISFGCCAIRCAASLARTSNALGTQLLHRILPFLLSTTRRLTKDEAMSCVIQQCDDHSSSIIAVSHLLLHHTSGFRSSSSGSGSGDTGSGSVPGPCTGGDRTIVIVIVLRSRRRIGNSSVSLDDRGLPDSSLAP